MHISGARELMTKFLIEKSDYILGCQFQIFFIWLVEKTTVCLFLISEPFGNKSDVCGQFHIVVWWNIGGLNRQEKHCYLMGSGHGG